MIVVVGVAAAAAAAIGWWRRMHAHPAHGAVVVSIKQQAGVLAAVVNMVNALLDALMLIRRVPANATTSSPSSPVPTFGQRSRDTTDHDD